VHLDAEALHRSREATLAPLEDLSERDRSDDIFRTDPPSEWVL
jgi:hypothetical protein